MSEWSVCPSCRLRHTRRADGICPRCHQSVDAAPAAEGAAPDPAVPAPPSSPTAPALGSLAQSARGKQLKEARNVLFVVGTLTLLLNVFLFVRARAEIDEEVKKLPANMVVSEEGLARAIRLVRLIYGGGILFGLGFIACGVFVRQHPVAATVTGLVLYLGGTAIFAFLDPTTLAQGLIVKGIIVMALIRSVQAAIAHRKEPEGAAQPA